MDAARMFFAEHYPSVARLVDELLADFSRRGVTTRRNWWVPSPEESTASRCP